MCLRRKLINITSKLQSLKLRLYGLYFCLCIIHIIKWWKDKLIYCWLDRMIHYKTGTQLNLLEKKKSSSHSCLHLSMLKGEQDPRLFQFRDKCKSSCMCFDFSLSTNTDVTESSKNNKTTILKINIVGLRICITVFWRWNTPFQFLFQRYSDFFLQNSLQYQGGNCHSL